MNVYDLIIIPCGSKKLAERSPAISLYQGAFFRACAKTADTLTAIDRRILSGKHGLLEYHVWVDPYEQRIDKPGAITHEELWQQAYDQGLLERRMVLALCPSAYAKVVRQLWPKAFFPLVGMGGIGRQMQILKEMRDAVERRAGSTQLSLGDMEEDHGGSHDRGRRRSPRPRVVCNSDRPLDAGA